MYDNDVLRKKVKKLNKDLVLITFDVIEECLCESFDVVEKNNLSHKRRTAPKSLK